MNIDISSHFTYKKLFRFVLPSIGTMVFLSTYSIVDALFISNYVGDTAFASINLIFPALMIFGCLGSMLGSGGSALIGKNLVRDILQKHVAYSVLLLSVLFYRELYCRLVLIFLFRF